MTRAIRLMLAALCTGTVLLAAGVPAALADADPPSDVLLLQDTYLPYQPPVSKPLADTLRNVVAAAKRAGYPIKVAIVATNVDLGAIPQLFDKPREYAPFLAREIAFRTRNPLLVVMSAGIATANVQPRAAAAIQGIAVDNRHKSDGLVRAAVEAVPKLATASGHPVPAPKLPPMSSGGGKGGGGTSPLLVFGAPVALVALAALVAALRRRNLDDEYDADEGETDMADREAGDVESQP
jgi:hypothetical protein